MRARPWILLASALAVVFATGPRAAAQASVDALRSQLLGRSVTVKIEGIRMTRSALFNKLDIRIVGGTVQNRLMKSQLDTDEVMHPGSRVRLTKVDASTDRAHDYLRFTVAAPDGLTVPVAFVLDKGQLASIDEPGLERIAASAFDFGAPGMPPAGAATGAPYNAPVPASPALSSSAAQPSSTRAVTAGGGQWRTGKTKDGSSAAELNGQASFKGQTGSTLLALSCSTAEVRVRKSFAPSAESLNCDFDTDSGNLNVSFTVGANPEETGGICYESKEANPTVVTLPIDLGAGALDEIVAAPGTALRLRVRFSDTPGDELTTLFHLPPDAAALAFLRSCAKPQASTASQDSGSSVTSCPAVPGKGLRKAAVLTAAAKPYTGTDSDNDIGAEWNLPRITKAHPTRPSLSLACFYGAGLKGPAEGTDETLERKLMPIPSVAKTCVSRGSAQLGEAYASCMK